MQRILVSHPSGNANVRQTVLAFAEAEMLDEFWTGINWNPDAGCNYFLPENFRRQVGRRSFPAGIAPLVKTYPWYEAARLIADKLGAYRLTSGEAIFSPVSCHVALDKRVAKRIRELPELNAVYAYDHCALESFRSAGAGGIKRIYDLPIGYWRAYKRICEEENELNPEWKNANPFIGLRQDVFLRKDEEIGQADAIIVASNFTRNTLIEFMPELVDRISVISYGSPPVISAVNTIEHVSMNPSKPLKILFVGQLGVTKGLPYLLDAIKKLGHSVELTLVGKPASYVCAILSNVLATYCWIESLSHNQVLEEMRKHDVFVFPSLFDGFGLVVLEAMSQGLPVIVTSNAGVADVVEDGVDGFIVPIRSSEAIAEKLELLIRDRDMLATMSQAALKKATYCSWDAYRVRLVEAVTKIIEGKE